MVYSIGGYTTPHDLLNDTIDRFPFALAITNAAEVGNLTGTRAYVLRWMSILTRNNMGINANSTIVFTDARDGYFNNLTYREQMTQLSPMQGYTYGYYTDYGPSSSRIIRFPFSSSVSASYVGEHVF